MQVRNEKKKRNQSLRLILCLVCAAVALCSLFHASSYLKRQRIPVLLYHHILADAENHIYRDNPSVVSLENFELQLQYLYDNNYHTITPRDLYEFLYNKQELPENSFLISFDDGYYSNIERAYPVLKKYGFKATIFDIAIKAEEPQQSFEPDAIVFVSAQSMPNTRDVFTYASHTYDLHREINGKTTFMLASREEIINDLHKSFAIVDDTTAFSYPLGQYDRSKINALKEAGVQMAFTVNKGYVAATDNPYKLRRFVVHNNTSMDEFMQYIDKANRSKKQAI